jgi:protein ImuB
MDLLACIDLALFDLQLLVRMHPEWSALPMVVLAEDRPSASVLVANAAARERGILPGHRYNQALSSASDLRAGVIQKKDREQALAQVGVLLRKHSPDLEPSTTWPGVFWLSARGMGLLYKSAKTWGRQIASELRQAGWSAHIVIGPTRFATYAAARGFPDPLDTKVQRRAPVQSVLVLKPDADQRQSLRDIALDRLDLKPTTRDLLANLGITRLGALLRLPQASVHERFGADVAALFALARGEAHDPLRIQAVEEPPNRSIFFDDPQLDLATLLFAIKRELVGLREQLVAQSAAIEQLFLSFILDRKAPREHLEVLSPAQPTLDVQAVMRLVHLRLEAKPLPAAVREVHLALVVSNLVCQQLELFSREQERSFSAAADALARIRAEVGNDAVVHLQAKFGHLPEAISGTLPFTAISLPAPHNAPQPTLVRRLFFPTKTLVAAPRHARNEGWHPLGHEEGSVAEIIGPYRFEGGWWRTPLEREYYYLRTSLGAWIWAYYDTKRRRWHCQAQVG